MRPIIIALLAALVLGNWPVYGVLLLIDDAAGQGEVSALAGVPQDSWREAHTAGAYRVREIALFVLSLLLLLAALLSFIRPGEKEREEGSWDDGLSF